MELYGCNTDKTAVPVGIIILFLGATLSALSMTGFFFFVVKMDIRPHLIIRDSWGITVGIEVRLCQGYAKLTPS